MNEKDPSAPSENRLSETESSLMPRGLSRGAGGARLGGEREAPQNTGEPKQVKIVLRIEAVESQLASVAQPAVETPAPALPQPPLSPSRQENEPQQIPARMLNEFVYCQRLFYYEFVEGVFVESVDTLRGEAIHKRVDSGNGALPAAKKKAKKTTQDEPAATVDATANEPEAQNAEPETIHSRSVQMGSERLGVVAKMDLVEVRAARANVATSEAEDLFSVLEVCPVDYKAGAPKEGDEANELWDTDKMQLGLQALILRDNGYICNEGVIYYRATKQRVRLPITPELENWILQNIAEAKRVIAGPIPAPLVHSPKCVRCSLAPVCLPDETRMLAQARAAIDLSVGEAIDTPEDSKGVAGEPPRRLIAARDDTRPLYLNTQGYRVGCKDEVLTVKEKDRVIEEVRMRDLSHVALFGNIQISTQAIQSLCEQEIPVTYFSMGGWFYGITRGHALKNVFLRMEQFRFARDETVCLSLARQFVHGKIRNHRTLLMRNHLEPPEPIILKLKRASEDALAAASIAELLGIEGAAASQYFQQFNGMVKVEDDDLPGLEMPGKNAKQLAFNFNFTNRNRRPPTDPVNAMLSLAYSMLAKDCTLAALAVGFDPYIGFYHQPRFGRPALGLDLMEEMRPLVAESTVLSCINNRVVTEKDFVRAGQAVNLTAPGRKRFFQMYEQRMSSLITHPLFDYKVSYRRALELQARLLAKTLTGEIAEYIPLLTR
jgi:CRISPR-associated protein Cas1